MDYSKKWYFHYAFPNTLPGSFCQAACSLLPGARDKDRIGDIIGRSIALEAPHTVSALSGYAASHYPLLMNILMLAGKGFLDVSSAPIWIEHESSWSVDYLDQVKAEHLSDDSVLKESMVGLGRTGYCFFVPEDRPELTGIAFVCSSRTMDRLGIPSSRNGESLSFLPYIVYIDRHILSEAVKSLTPTRMDRYAGRLYDGSQINSLTDAENVLVQAARFAPMDDIIADAKVLNEWTDEQQKNYVEQSFRAISSALFRAISCLGLLQLPGVTAGLPGNITFRSNDGATEAYWKPSWLKRPIHPRVSNLTPETTGQTFVTDRFPHIDDAPEETVPKTQADPSAT